MTSTPATAPDHPPPAEVDVALNVVAARRQARRDVVPLLAAFAPVGLVAAATGAASQGALAGALAAPLLMSGSAHFALLSMHGAAALTTVVVVAVVLSRCVVYSAALADGMRGQPAWFRWIAAWTLIDQIYALVDQRRAELRDPDARRAYHLGLAGPVAIVWIIAGTVGATVGSVLPTELRTDLVIVALVVSMLRPAVTTSANRRIALVAGGVTLVASILPLGTGMLVGTFAGLAAASRIAGGERS
ncbi:MAG: AzlC family ABC transporter permease [Actinomycetota bacterium]